MYICSNKNNSNINVFNSGVLLIEIVVFNWIKLNLLCVQFGCQLCSNRAVDVVDNQYTHSHAHIHAHSHTTRKLFMNFRLVVSLNVLIIGFILCRTRYCCCSRQQLSTYGLLACLAKHLQYSPTPLTNLLPPFAVYCSPTCQFVILSACHRISSVTFVVCYVNTSIYVLFFFCCLLRISVHRWLTEASIIAFPFLYFHELFCLQ